MTFLLRSTFATTGISNKSRQLPLIGPQLPWNSDTCCNQHAIPSLGLNILASPVLRHTPSGVRKTAAPDLVSGIGLATWPDIPLHGGVAQGFLLIPVSGVDEAEGRDREQIGDEKIGGNGRNGTSKRDMI